MRGFLVFALVAPLLGACATGRGPTGPVADLRPAESPSGNTDEAGMWMQTERTETRMRISAAVVHDPALNDYIHGLVCRLSAEHCAAIRVYVVRDPAFMASMGPTGLLKVHTGLLLRMANEAQLSFVLGHEIGHYVRRHSLQRWEDFKAKSTYLGLEAESIAEFSRVNEREADQIGYTLLVKAGYDPREAARVWEAMLAESPSKNPPPTLFIGAHPSTAERLANLRESAATAATTGADLRIGRDEYLAQLKRIRHWLLDDEVGRRQFKQTQVVMRRLIEEGDGLGDLHFHAGEMHRRRGAPEDLTTAISEYRRALDFPDAPPEAYRSLGIVYARRGDRTAARDAFARYLEKRPTAEDHELIERQLADLEAPR